MIDYESKCIRCDTCGAVYVSATAQEAERECQEDGWFIGFAKDECPSCFIDNRMADDED